MSTDGLKFYQSEFGRIIFHAAREGKLYRLKVFLDQQSKEENKQLVSVPENGTTPLAIACKNGHLDVVSYLIERCDADIEQIGCVMFDNQRVEGAPPLWCAAAAGYLNIVKYLLKHKASVNSATKSKSTPLRAACFDGHFEIAKCLVENGADIEIANKHGHTCLMIACYKGHYKIAKYLVECGADVNRKSNKGNTALHDCAESGNLDLVKLLQQNGATFVPDCSGKTPILAAAFIGHPEIVEYFIKEFNCTREEKINALELLGATLIDEKHDIVFGFSCWLRAMKMRHRKNCVIEKPIARPPIAAYVNATEIRTLEELDELITNPDEIRMQAILIRERVLGPGLTDNIHYIRKRGACCADQGDFDTCIQLWMYALDVQRKTQEPLSQMTQSSVLAFIELFSYMMSDAWQVGRGYPVEVTFRAVFSVFERALDDIENALKQKYYDADLHRFLVVTLHLIGLMFRLDLSKIEELKLKKGVCRLVHANPRGRNGWTLLHIACFKDTSSLSRHRIFLFPSLAVVDLLLEVGAFPNALDSNHNTPLHTAAMNKPFVQTVFNSLLNHGAHLDLCNNEKQTPLQLAQDIPSLDIHPLQFVNLQCLSAKAIQSHKIPYKGLVHKRLETFVDMH